MVRHYLLFPDVLFLLAELPVLALLPEELLVLLPDALLLLEVFPVVPLLFEELPALLPVVLFLLVVPELPFLLVVLFLFFVELPELDWVDSVFVLLLELDEELLPPEQAVMENANAPIIPTTKPFLASSLTLNFLFIFFISHLSFSVLILLGETSGVPGSSCCISKDLFSFDDAYYEGESLTDSKRNPNKSKMWPFSLPASLSHCSP